MKNVIKLDNYYSPGELKDRLSELIDYYNNHRHHKSLNNLTPTDVFYGRDQEVLARKEVIKQRTLLKRKLDFELKKTALI